MYGMGLVVLGLWSSVMFFSQNDVYENFEQPLENSATDDDGIYDFEPDPGSPGVEVAPLDVNADDEDVPYPTITSDETEADDADSNDEY